jgi:thioredoxin 1
MVSPVVEGIATKYPGRLKVAKVNVDDNPKVARDYQAMSIPMLLLVVNGEVVDSMVGAVPEAKLDAFVRRVLR